jgi:hypothetical protein
MAVFAITGLTVSGITNTSAVGVGKITNEGSETIVQVGFHLSTVNPLIYTAFTCNYPGVGINFRCPITGLDTNESYTAVVFASGSTGHTGNGLIFITALNAPKVGKIVQPLVSGDKGSVSFIDLFNDSSIIKWTGAATGSTTPFANTGITITGLTIGTYYFTIKLLAGPSTPDSPITTVIIALSSTRVLSAANYRLYERTGIGDGVAYNAEIAAIEALDEYETFEDDY